jgi:hypothetical protein
MCQSAVCHCDKLPKVINLKGGLMDVVYGTSPHSLQHDVHHGGNTLNSRKGLFNSWCL